MQTARSIALEALAFFDSNGYISFKKVEMAISTLSSKDRALCSNLIFETLRKRIRLDYELSKYLKKPSGLPNSVLNALRLGALQLLFMDGIPPYAAIHSTVELVGVNQFKRVANAVLRKVSDNGLSEDVPLNMEFSHPAWLVDYWRGLEYIHDLEGLLDYNQSLPIETFEVSIDERELVESGYLFERSEFSDLYVFFQKGLRLEGIEKRDELEYVLKETGLHIIRYGGSSTGRLNERPWLFHTLSIDQISSSGLEAERFLSQRAAEIEAGEFIFCSQALTREENTQPVRALISSGSYRAVSMDEFLAGHGIKGIFDGFGYWLLPGSSPLPGYVCRLERRA